MESIYGSRISVLQDEKKFWRWIAVMVAQQCERTWYYWTVHLNCKIYVIFILPQFLKADDSQLARLLNYPKVMDSSLGQIDWPGGAKIKHLFWACLGGCFRINRSASPVWVGIAQSSEGPNKIKTPEGTFCPPFFPASLLSWDISLHLLFWDRDLHHQLL